MKCLHHPICRVTGGSNHPDHLMLVEKRREDKMHAHEGVRLFHQKLLHLIDDWHTNDVIPEVREKVRDVIQEIGPEMYQPYAVRDWTKIRGSFEKKNGLYIPKSYEGV